MRNCRWTKDIERWFDGEGPDGDRVQRHVDECAACAAHLAQLRTLREGGATAARREEIQDPQFPAFFDGIREAVEAPRRRRGGLWALASVSAAALVVAVSLFVMLDGGPQPGAATVIESYSTDLEGATITTSDSENGVPTVWITVTQDDIL